MKKSLKTLIGGGHMSLNRQLSGFTPILGLRKFETLKKKTKAFTLAEVLLTLVIIGIVAALVIPSVVSKYKRKVVEVQLMKSYNTLFNGFQKAEESCGSVSGMDASYGYFDNCVIPNLKVTKLRGKYKDNGYTDGIRYPNGEYFNEQLFAADSNTYSYKLDDGSVIGEGMPRITLTFIGWTNYIKSSVQLRNTYMFVDINGSKGPNVIGKDVFVFEYINKDSKITAQDSQTSQALTQNNIRYLLVMNGEFEINSGEGLNGPDILKQNSLETIKNKCKDTSKGYNAKYCGAWIRLNGWKIPEDYPYL